MLNRDKGETLQISFSNSSVAIMIQNKEGFVSYDEFRLDTEILNEKVFINNMHSMAKSMIADKRKRDDERNSNG